MKFTVNTNDNDWEQLVLHSPQGSIFSSSRFLKSMALPNNRFIVTLGNDIVAGVLVVTDFNGSAIVIAPAPFTQFQGVLFSGSIYNQSTHKINSTIFSATELIIRELYSRYSTISLSLHPTVVDLRPYTWFNYHERSKGVFAIENAFTGIINMSHYDTFDDYLSKIRATRRNEYRKAQKIGLTTEISMNIDLLIELYISTFKRQAIEVRNHDILQIRNIINMATLNGYGQIRVCRMPDDKIISATFFVYYKDTAYYLIGANDPDYRNIPGGVFTFLESVKHSLLSGFKCIDVCGMNSPMRGEFKSSFNAELLPYHNVTLMDR